MRASHGILRISLVLVCCAVLANAVQAQVVRFDTNVGTIDMIMNPTNNADLQPYVDNLLQYVTSGRYNRVVINRAADGVAGDPTDNFVLQMGGFQATTTTVPDNFTDLTAVPSFANLTQDTTGDNVIDLVDAEAVGLSNNRGTVAFAMSSLASGISNVNSATREFFINAGDNFNLDASSGQAGGFVPFAEVRDMATVDLILGLQQQPTPDGDGRASDLPVLNGNQLVYIQSAYIVELNLDEDETELAASLLSESITDTASEGVAAASALSDTSSLSTSSLQTFTVPEPPALVLAVGALVAIYMLKPNKLR